MKALFDNLLKYKKTTFTSILLVLFVSVSEWGAAYLKEEIQRIKTIEELSKGNEIRITNLEYKANYYDELIKTIVTRTSFDNYILRKDREMEEQAQFNLSLNSKLNKVEGRVYGLENVVYELNNYELYNKKDISDRSKK